MKWTALPLSGAYLLEIQPISDERGFFARTWCSQEARDLGLSVDFVQSSLSYNNCKGTLRGMHYQCPPHAETKLVRCTAGSIYDVLVDLRPDSPTFCKWFAIELSAKNRKSVYIPVGFAHGFQSLSDHSEVSYQISEHYHPECARGVRWNDKVFGMEWPLEVVILSERDRSFPDFLP
ncbi:MAG TPA: dTDP-4-dehydrorhamnose 3,5-epimerase [Dongiaceae bacterium]|nr:dTDP-4-dehydrorhamnose 3,5-epimerase [Dongiaceae bacterium]